MSYDTSYPSWRHSFKLVDHLDSCTEQRFSCQLDLPFQAILENLAFKGRPSSIQDICHSCPAEGEGIPSFKDSNLASSEERWCEGLLLIFSAVGQRQRPRLLTPPDQRYDIRENQRNFDRILNRIMECFCWSFHVKEKRHQRHINVSSWSYDFWAGERFSNWCYS